MIVAFGIGAVSGFIGSVPVAGPVAVLALQRGFERRYREGLAVGCGAALVEAVYATLAGLGPGRLLAQIPGIHLVANLLIAALCGGLAWYFLSAVAGDPALERHTSPAGRRGFLLGLSVTVINPMVIFSWTAYTTTLIGNHWMAATLDHALAFGLGVGLGIGGWFALLMAVLARHDGHLDERWQRRLRRACAVLLACMAAAFAVTAAVHRPA